jgi:hypothetical protein
MKSAEMKVQEFQTSVITDTDTPRPKCGLRALGNTAGCAQEGYVTADDYEPPTAGKYIHFWTLNIYSVWVAKAVCLRGGWVIGHPRFCAATYKFPAFRIILKYEIIFKNISQNRDGRGVHVSALYVYRMSQDGSVGIATRLRA